MYTYSQLNSSTPNIDPREKKKYIYKNTHECYRSFIYNSIKLETTFNHRRDKNKSSTSQDELFRINKVLMQHPRTKGQSVD